MERGSLPSHLGPTQYYATRGSRLIEIKEEEGEWKEILGRKWRREALFSFTPTEKDVIYLHSGSGLANWGHRRNGINIRPKNQCYFFLGTTIILVRPNWLIIFILVKEQKTKIDTRIGLYK